MCVCVSISLGHIHIPLQMYLMGMSVVEVKNTECAWARLFIFSTFICWANEPNKLNKPIQTNTCNSHRKGWQSLRRVMTIMTGTEPQSLSRVTHNKAHSVRLKFLYFFKRGILPSSLQSTSRDEGELTIYIVSSFLFRWLFSQILFL
jgi:hypothetical protein